jgi:outer membrane PBP1 activator LpoA protein
MCERISLCKRFQSEDDNNTAATATLCLMSEDEYRDATDRLQTDGKSVWTVRAFTLCRGRVCERCGMSLVL